MWVTIPAAQAKCLFLFAFPKIQTGGRSTQPHTGEGSGGKTAGPGGFETSFKEGRDEDTDLPSQQDCESKTSLDYRTTNQPNN